MYNATGDKENGIDFDLSKSGELLRLIKTENGEETSSLFKNARAVCDRNYGRSVYFRGLIEFTNYCGNNCYYCGIRLDNKKSSRYRLDKKEILECCRQGYALGFRTFVLQGGEDPYFTDKKMADIIAAIRKAYPDCAITLSIGERSKKSYEAFYRAGADRYLLRHETANEIHYSKLHPPKMRMADRKKCLYELKDIGFQVGAGFMVGLPYQTPETLLEDLLFLKELQPHMVGIGPFIPHSDTPFGKFSSGTVDMTLKMVALCRLILPQALIPATTALGTIDPSGREKALMAGANVVMPNLSPVNVREKYTLYNNKACTGEEAAEYKSNLESRIRGLGFEPDFSRGDHISRQSYSRLNRETT